MNGDRKTCEELLLKREQFPFYNSFFRAIDRFPEDKDRLALYEAIIKYSFYGEEPMFENGMCYVAWDLMKPNLDSSIQHFLNGKKGGCPKGIQNNPNGTNQYSKELEDNREDKGRITKRISNKNKNKEKEYIITDANASENKNITSEEKVFIDGMNNNYPRVMSMKKPLTYSQYLAINEKYNVETITIVLQNMENCKDLNKKYISASMTLQNWLRNNNK